MKIKNYYFNEINGLGPDGEIDFESELRNDQDYIEWSEQLRQESENQQENENEH